MCRWLMDAVPWDQGTAAVLHGPAPHLLGIADAEHSSGQAEEQLCRDRGPGHWLGAGAVVERLEDSGCWPGWM